MPTLTEHTVADPEDVVAPRKPKKGRKTKRGTRKTAPVVSPEPVEAVAPAAPAKRTTKKRPAKKATTARKTASTKRPAAKKAAPVRRTPTAERRKPGPKPTERPLENPYRPGSNSFHYTEILKKGGRRSTMVNRLKNKINVHPWSGAEFDNIEAEIDKRLTMVAKSLEKDYKWLVSRGGRGSESTIKATPPSRRPRTASKATKTVKTAKTTKATKKTAKRRATS